MTLLDENIVNDGECAKPFSINLMNEKQSLPFTMISGLVTIYIKQRGGLHNKRKDKGVFVYKSLRKKS